MKPVPAVLFPRRDLLKAGGTLLIGMTMCGAARSQETEGVALALGPDQPDPKSLDTWIAIHADNTATIFIGFVELGQGCSTALLQLAAEELDLDMSQVKTIRLESHTMPNQGGTVASASIARGGPRIRSAAAEARQALLKMAAQTLSAPVDRLTVSKGIVSVTGDAKKSVTYGQLIGDKPFHLPYTGKAPLKSFREYKVVGTRIPRLDIPGKAAGTYVHMQHMRVAGMLHGRVVRPRGQGAYGDGAKVLSVDESSIAAIQGARVIRKRDFVGVVAANEWDAVSAARQLKVAWDRPASLPGTAGMHQQMRAAKTTDRVVLNKGAVADALKGAAHAIMQTYQGPYQAHVPFGPNCALADVKADSALVMCSTQNIYDARNKVAQVLGLPVERVTVRYYEGSGTYGRSCYDDAAQAAAILSQAVGQPVRLQFMRWDEHGWDNFGPAHLADVRAGIDGGGKIVAYEYQGWQHNWGITETSQQLALGTPAAESSGSVSQEISPFNLGAMYVIPNMRLVNHRVDGVLASLKGSNLRSPLDLSFSFASEQTIDELAELAGMDPYEFRRHNMTDERWLGVLNAVAQAANWKAGRAGGRSNEKIVTGRGIALGTHTSSYAAAVAEIEVDRETGKIVAKHMYGALDAGQTVNPALLENQISGMLVQATSRMLKEEVTFSNTNVTSLDWNSYPILRFEECPGVTPIVVQRLDQPSSGGGEEVLGPAAAAIANALYDATGARLREYPLTPARVLAALRRK
jgi:CO/xanthine dehydrogenase Mo-binding subunit